MSPDSIYPLVNGIALCGWLALALFPRRNSIVEILTGTAIPAFMAVLYVGIVSTMWGSASGGFSSLSGVSELFTSRWLLLAGWTHYLAFDLLIGNWEARDARQRGIPHLLLLPCLALTFLFGPSGWLLYALVRNVAAKG